MSSDFIPQEHISEAQEAKNCLDSRSKQVMHIAFNFFLVQKGNWTLLDIDLCKQIIQIQWVYTFHYISQVKTYLLGYQIYYLSSVQEFIMNGCILKLYECNTFQ